MSETMVTIPMGTTVISIKELMEIKHENAEMHNTMDILYSVIGRIWTDDCKKGYTPTVYCKEIADIIGLELPVVEREVNE